MRPLTDVRRCYPRRRRHRHSNREPVRTIFLFQDLRTSETNADTWSEIEGRITTTAMHQHQGASSASGKWFGWEQEHLKSCTIRNTSSIILRCIVYCSIVYYAVLYRCSIVLCISSTHGWGEYARIPGRHLHPCFYWHMVTSELT
jgi:hypothetical protein